MLVSPRVRLGRYLLEHPYLRQWLIISLMLGMFATVVVYDLRHEYTQAQRNTEERLQMQAQMIEDNLAKQLQAVNSSLHDIIRDIPVWQREPGGQRGAMRRLGAMCATMPGVRSLHILDAKGIVTVSSLPGLVGRDLSQRNYFQLALLESNPQTLYVSEPFIAITGNQILTLTRSYSGGDGEFAGIVVAAIDPEYFFTVLRSALYAPDMWATISHQDGQPFVMVPGTSSKLPHDPLLDQYLRSNRRNAILRGPSALSQDDRIVAYQTLHPPQLNMDRALVIGISRNADAILASWYELLFTLGSAGIVVCLITIGLQRYHQHALARVETEAERALSAQQAAERRFITAFSEAPIGMALIGSHGLILQANRALWEMLGYPPEALIGIALDRLAAPETSEPDRQLMQELLQGRRSRYQREKCYIHHDGHKIWMLVSAAAVCNAQGQVEYVIKQIQDISLLKAQESQLEYLAHHDKLTGLPNRSLLLDRIQQGISNCQRHGRQLAVCFLDLDDFKPINDIHGHAAGDEVLVISARRMTACLRGEDTITRLGGDEFVIVLAEVDSMESCLATIERLRLAIEQPITLNSGITVHVSGSFGISLHPHDGSTPEQLLRQADHAMYAAKYAGGHRSQFSASTVLMPSPSNLSH